MMAQRYRSGWWCSDLNALFGGLAFSSISSGLSYPLDSATEKQLLDISTKVVPTDTLQDLFKTVLEIGIDHYFSGDSSWTSGDVLYLRDVASLCPLKYGPGVYQARSLLLSMDTTIVFYTNSCELPVAPSGRYAAPAQDENEYHGTLNIYPNPSTGSVTVECQLKDGEKGLLYVFDMTGRSVYQNGISCDTGTIQINNLSEGLYQCYLSIDGKPVLHQKLVIMNDR